MRSDAVRLGVDEVGAGRAGIGRPAAIRVDAARPLAAAVARRLARAGFGAVVVLSPLRAGITLVSRPEPPIYSAYTDFGVSWSEIAILVTVGCWLAGLLAAPRPVTLGPAFLRWPALGLVAVAWLTVPTSVDPPSSAFNAATLTIFAAFAAYVLNELDSIAGMLVPLVAMVAIEAVVGIGQVAGQRSLGLSALGELVLDPARNGTSVVSTSAADRLLRAYGLSDHPNILGGLLAFGLPLVALGAATVLRRADTSPNEAAGLASADVRRRVFGRELERAAAFSAGVAAIALTLVTLFLTFSRAAWLAAAVALLVGGGMLARSRGPAFHAPGPPGGRRATAWGGARPWLIAGIVAVPVAALLLASFGRYVGARVGLDGTQPATEAMSLGERPVLVAAAVSVFAGHPVTGTGLGTLPLALHRADPSLDFDAQPAPFVLVDAAAEVGIAGALSYLGLIVAPWIALLRRPRRWTPDLAAASAALAAVLVVGLFDYYTWSFPAGRTWAWLVLGLWAGAYGRRARADERGTKTARPAPMVPRAA